MPILLYATEACPLLSHQKHSLQFSLTRIFMKLFCSGSADIVAECQRNFVFLPIKLQIRIRTARFLQMFAASQNSLCSLFNSKAILQLNTMFGAVDKSITTACQLKNFIYEQFTKSC